MPEFRVLSLNGGGIRGVYSSSFLAKLEELLELKHPIADYFDLIVGTSTGGLIAISLALHQTSASIRDFYLEHGPSIFPSGQIQRRWLLCKQIVFPKHDPLLLGDAIQMKLPANVLLGNVKRPVVVTTFDAASGTPRCFKSRHHADFVNDHKLPAWEIAMATAAAPTFYRAFTSECSTDSIDGGVWANCPILVGIIEAIHRFQQQPRDIRVLNVGTTKAPFHLRPKARKGGAWWNVSMVNHAVIDMMMAAAMASAVFMAQQLIGNDNVVVIDDNVDSGRFNLDDARTDSMRDLRALGERRAKIEAKSLEAMFFGRPAAPWQPVP